MAFKVYVSLFINIIFQFNDICACTNSDEPIITIYKKRAYIACNKKVAY